MPEFIPIKPSAARWCPGIIAEGLTKDIESSEALSTASNCLAGELHATPRPGYFSVCQSCMPPVSGRQCRQRGHPKGLWPTVCACCAVAPVRYHRWMRWLSVGLYNLCQGYSSFKSVETSHVHHRSQAMAARSQIIGGLCVSGYCGPW